MCKFNTIIRIKDLNSSQLKTNENYTIDITDYNVTEDELTTLQALMQKYNFDIVDTNWFGGTWSAVNYLKAEIKLDKVASVIKNNNLSQFESFICAYHFASNRKYSFAPKGSPFQMCRSYVDVLNYDYCVCVGYATVLKRLCDKMNIECAVQGCLAKDKSGKIVNHANNLVYIKDDKYHIDGLFYSDSRMDCSGFAESKSDSFSWNLNSLALPITDVGKIVIKVWNDDTIIEMNDFQSLYYSRKLSQGDKEYLSKFFSKATIENIMEKKYCKPIEDKTIFEALQNIGLDEKQVSKIKETFFSRKALFISDRNSNSSWEEWEQRLAFAKYLIDFISHKGRKNDVTKLDCATFVKYVFHNYFDINILKDGYGKSWTGVILTSPQGQTHLIDENFSLQQKVSFVDTKCKIGDILFFHRQSQTAIKTSEDNWYPGHCGIYLGNHKYIDSRLTTRGDIAIVNMKNDCYMKNFIGFKNIISDLHKTPNIEQNVKK